MLVVLEAYSVFFVRRAGDWAGLLLGGCTFQRRSSDPHGGVV